MQGIFIVVGIKFNPHEDGYKTKVVYTQVTKSSWSSRTACVDWAFKNGATGVFLYPSEMIDHIEYLSPGDMELLRQKIPPHVT